MIVDIKNDTSFCCSVPNASSSFVWSGFIYVNDVGTRWFTDTAGIVATPTPTRATLAPPGGATTSPVSSGSHGDHVSQEGDSTSSSSGGPDGQSSSSNGEDTALILGISILGISAVVVVMVLVYFKWWKPRQESGGNTMSDHQKHRNEHEEHLMRSSSVTIDGFSGPAANAKNSKLLDAMDSDVELL